jgi:hypothetical protein
MTSPPPHLLTVRYNRRRLWWSLAVTAPLTVAVYFLPVASSHAERFLGVLVLGLTVGPTVLSIMSLFRKAFLVYDVQRGTLLGPHGRKRWYPGDGYLRLEYSVYDARIYEVAPDGRRRKVIGSSVFADRQDWEALVDVLIAQQDTQPSTDRFERDHVPSAADDAE